MTASAALPQLGNSKKKPVGPNPAGGTHKGQAVVKDPAAAGGPLTAGQGQQKSPLDVLETILDEAKSKTRTVNQQEQQEEQQRQELAQQDAQQKAEDAQKLRQQIEELKTVTQTPAYQARVEQEQEKQEEQEKEKQEQQGYQIVQLEHTKV